MGKLRPSLAFQEGLLAAFYGCGTGRRAEAGRKWLGVDISPTRCNVMGQRLKDICGMRQADQPRLTLPVTVPASIEVSATMPQLNQGGIGTVQKWEYRCLRLVDDGGSVDDPEFTAQATELGQESWELFCRASSPTATAVVR